MPGTTVKDALATELLGDGAGAVDNYTGDVAFATTDFDIPHPGKCTAVLTVGAVTGTDPSAVVTIGAGDGTNWAIIGTIALTEADANTVLSVPIDDGGNGPFITVGLELGGTSEDFELLLFLEAADHDNSPLMALGNAVHTTPTPTAGTPNVVA